MRKWKTHTPEGALDVLEAECAIKRNIEGSIKKVYQSSGYFEIQTPMFEFYDVFAGEAGGVEQSLMFKFFDRQGRILVLRPDLTTPIARICATKYAGDSFPRRLSYTGSAFRDGGAVAGAVQKQFTQAGIELIGHSVPEADAEVIAVTIQALLECGLEDFQIDIGQAELFKGIMEQADLSGSVVEQIRTLIDQKNVAALKELAQGWQIDGEAKALISELPNLFGGMEIIEKMKGENLGERAKCALDNLSDIYNILLDYGFEKYISIDLGMVQGLNYYTGAIVKGFARGVGFPICGGGRYDNLIGEFGKSRPATGIAIGIERVISALNYKNAEFSAPAADTLICCDGDRALAFRIAQSLRKNGVCAEMWLGEGDAEQYAEEKGIGGIIRVTGPEKIEIINLTQGGVKTTSINELLGGEAT